MRYSIKTYGMWHTSWWKDDTRQVHHASMDEYSSLDEETFKNVLHDELDVPDYEMTVDSVKKQYGCIRENELMSDECALRIVHYYEFRRSLYDEILKLLSAEDGIVKRMLDSQKLNSITWHFNIPPEGNNYSCEDPDYTGGQVEAWIEVSISNS